MGKILLYTLVILLVSTVMSFILGYHKFGYFVGSIFGSVALGAGYVYTSKDDKYSTNYLNMDDVKKNE